MADPSTHPLAELFPWATALLGGAAGVVSAAWKSGARLGAIETTLATRGALLVNIDQKLDHVVTHLALIGSNDARRSAEIEALRRDVSRLEDNAA